MAESVVSGVVSRLGDLLIQEANFLSEVSNQVRLLQIELILIQCLLKDADASQNESALVRQWVSEIRDLAYDAEDIIGTYVLTVASRSGGGIQKVLKRYVCILDEGIRVHKLGSEIADIMTEISNLKRSFEAYGIGKSTIRGGDPGASNETQREQRQTYSHLGHDVVGFEEDLNKLVTFLLKREESNRVNVASICGMGGLGKTTLAKMVYNHDKIKKHFKCRAWVFISQQCQTRIVWQAILFGLLSPSKELRDELQQLADHEIVEKLRRVQCQQKCLVILDDIWNTEHWDILREAFPVGSKILLTSRNKAVALHADPDGFHHEVQFLNDEKSWELLEKRAISRRSEEKKDERVLVPGLGSLTRIYDRARELFYYLKGGQVDYGEEHSKACGHSQFGRVYEQDSIINTNMESLGNEMLKYCGGLPLAIAVLGGLLAAKHTREEWEDVHRHVKSYLNAQEGLQSNKDKVLALSYNELPCHLKPCFLYLGHFPEGFEISTKELVRMWMAEGFIQKIQHERGREDTMEDVGERYLQELVQRCMVLVGKISSFGRIKTCRINDHMRDLCVSKAQAENFLQITNIRSMEESVAHIGKIRRLAINVESDHYNVKAKGIKFNEHPYLRSLLYFGQHDLLLFKEFRFKNFRLLRVLNLIQTKPYKSELPKDIGCLIHLRFLSLKDSYVTNMPSSMGNLRYLQTLDLRYSKCDVRVPNVFKRMEQLRHLYLPRNYEVYEKLELGNLCYLQTLKNVWPKKIQLPTSFTFNCLRVLKVGSPDFELGPDIIEIQIVSSCPHIYKLRLFGNIKKLPEVDQFSSNLAKLTLTLTKLKEDPMARLEKLRNLKILRLLGISYLGNKMVCSERGFPQLQSLLLRNLPNLDEWSVKEGAMPSLRCLQIEGCWKLTTIPDGLRFVTTPLTTILDGLRFVTTLQELEIKNMPTTFTDSVKDFCKVQYVPSLVFEDCDE